MTRYNVRVYGLLLRQGKVLVGRERYGSHTFLKFPGGGLEDGEGTIAALKREFDEEMNVAIEPLSHFYTTDFYQKSMFDEQQVLSIYYTIELLQELTFPLETASAMFHFLPVNEDLIQQLSLPIDKVVAGLLVAAEG